VRTSAQLSKSAKVQCMLVLKRKIGESILIDNQIEITILNNTKSVKVGIDAPKDINIVRTELIKKEYPIK
jgi:carbon storage regulator